VILARILAAESTDEIAKSDQYGRNNLDFFTHDLTGENHDDHKDNAESVPCSHFFDFGLSKSVAGNYVRVPFRCEGSEGQYC
jgi:hypothetical protein